MEKILVVDDNEVICDMLYDVLVEWGFCVEKAYQGMEVLPLVEAFHPDLILLDVMLPGMNGFEICKRIKSDPNKEHIAVILLTVLSEVDDRTQAVNVGADLFLSKPVNYKELRKQIGSVLGNKKKLAEMETMENVCEFILNLIGGMDKELYEYTKMLRQYCDKLSRILNLAEEEITKISRGVVVYALGRFMINQGMTQIEVEQIISPLKFSTSILPYLNYDKNKYSERDMYRECTNVRIVIFVEKFCELKNEYGSSQKALSVLSDKSYNADPVLINGLEQIISEENFVNDLEEILKF